MNKVQSYVTEYFYSMPLQEVNYLSKLLEGLPLFIEKEYMHSGLESFLNLAAIMSNNEAMLLDSLQNTLFISLFDTILELFSAIENIKKVAKEENKEASTYVRS